ncbi:Chloride channel protein 2-like 7 [Homarus americanus]|uniref:Chloride channel protein 2-like 7 n=1 Tax=Homarus americanus TaxID=6706 RepID=A0A8J5JWP5_HOMAM|nr:Chloride channel protein 2-like 7 [Homarus americanus]
MNTKSIVFLLVLVIVAVTVVNVLYERLCTVYQSYMNTKYRVPVFMNTFARNSNKEISKCGIFFPSPIFFHDKSEISGVYDKHGGGSRRCLVFVLSTLNPIGRCLMMIHRVDVMFLFLFPETLTALFKTNFNVEYPFDPQELFVFALIG